MSEKTLAGEVALVTGSGRGLGFAIADRLAELGAAVAVHDISQEAPAEFGEHRDLDEVATVLAARHDVPTIAVIGNIADETQVAEMTSAAETALGPVSILVNCAGGDIALAGGKPQPNDALGVPLPDVRAILDRNLVGTLLVCQAVCPGMRERGQGSVVNIASGAAHQGVTDGVIYAVAKAGVAHWTRCLSKELRPFGVRVNTVSPGATKTARFLVTRKTDPDKLDESHPLARYGTPEEIADVVAFLCGPASRFVSGQTLRVDGGASA
jgi:3-oxoacyl-[acyl-carrier protein] reductase